MPSLTKSQAVDLVKRFAADYDRSRKFGEGDISVVESGQEILALGLADQHRILQAAMVQYIPIAEQTGYATLSDLEGVLLTQSQLPLSKSDLNLMCAQLEKRFAHEDLGWSFQLMNALSKFSDPGMLSDDSLACLVRAADAVRDAWGAGDRDATEVVGQINVLCGAADSCSPIVEGEPWADKANEWLASCGKKKKAAWDQLLQHCLKANKSKPDKKWLASATTLLRKIPASEFEKNLSQWLPLLAEPRTIQGDHWYEHSLDEGNQDLIKGLIWCLPFRPSESFVELASQTASIAYKKFPGVGPKSSRIGNACFYALYEMAKYGGIAQLSVLKTKVKQQTAKKQLDGYLASAAKEQGVSTQQVEEQSVPDLGLTAVGMYEESVRNYVCRIDFGANANLVWVHSDGKTLKTLPAALKTNKKTSARISEIKKLKKDVEKMMAAQRHRIESFYLQPTKWTFADWKTQYLEHRLVGVLSRSLIWEFQIGSKWKAGIFHGEKLVGANGKLLSKATPKNVRLWHPIGKSTEEIAGWRDFLCQQEIKQPFKQAHREVYVLTSAEKRTRDRSNRFAAHIVKQSQLRTLAQTRGWKAELLGPWDGGSSGTASRRLPEQDLTAVFFYDAAEAGGSSGPGWNFLSTDQVRFVTGADKEDVPLADIPELVLSEILRDVDLFVSVSSVGNDESWNDQGDRLFREYWTDFAFGKLNENAKTRKAALESIVPKLRIAGQCSVKGKFLVVKGKIKTYKIHLGSSNVLMEPGSKYLCVIPGRSGEAANLFLPFEGDRILSIILSKAFLLADDEKIKDKSILSQIQA